jgi:outer membrane protein TolC
MNRQLRSAVAVFLVGLTVLTGCHPTQPFYLHEDGDLSHYIETAQEMEVPDLDTHSLDEVIHAQAPLSLSNPEPKEFWDLSLEEAISTTLQNSKVLRQLGGAVAVFRGQRTSPDLLLRAADQANTVYQPALQASNTLNFGGANGIPGAGIPGLGLAGIPGTAGVGGGRAGIQGQGVEDALAAYDADFSTSLFWNTTDRQLRPNQISVPVPVQQNQANFQAQIAKRSVTGTELFARARTAYDRLDQPATAVPSIFTQELEVEARHPLLRGSGTMVNRVPIVIARTNEDIVLADFEVNVRNLVSEVENAYWDLYASYRDLEAAKAARDVSLRVWRTIHARFLEGGASAHDEAQSQEQYWTFKSQVEENYVVLLTRERHVRYLLGLTPSDHRLIRPQDEPTSARMEFEWCDVQAESLTRSPELRRQKWRMKQRELELIFYRNQLLPQLDVVGLYRWVGVGDELVTSDRRGLNFPTPGSTAFDELTEGNFQEARIGVQLSPPQFGARRELARIRHQQLLMAEAKAVLEDMELTVLHRVTQAIVDADAEYHLAQTAFNRWTTSQREVESLEAIVLGGGAGQGGPQALTNLLDALRRQADAQREFYQRLVNYNKAIADVHLAKGSLLEYDGVFLAEGPWPKKAYWDALGHARRRDASYYLDYGWTRPGVVSRGPMAQAAHGPHAAGAPKGIPAGAELQGEIIPTPPPSDGDAGEGPVAPDTLPTPSLEGPVTQRGDAAATSLSSGAGAGSRFNWGAVGLGSRPDYEVRQASAATPIEPPQSSRQVSNTSALEWAMPNTPDKPASRTAAAGDWKPATP